MLFTALWGLLGLMIGPALLLFAPLLIGIAIPKTAEYFGRAYAKWGIQLVGSSALVARNQGGLELSSTSDDPKFDADRITVGGEDGHARDTLGVKGYLFSKPFGIALESAPVYVSPLFAELGAAARRARDTGRLGPLADGGLRLDFEVPEFPQIPDLRDARYLFDGNADERSGIVAEDWTIKSQQKFHEGFSVGQTIMLILAFCAGAGMGLLVLKYGPSAPGTNIAIQIGVLV